MLCSRQREGLHPVCSPHKRQDSGKWGKGLGILEEQRWEAEGCFRSLPYPHALRKAECRLWGLHRLETYNLQIHRLLQEL